MKIIYIILVLLIGGLAFAEEEVSVDMSSIYQFAEQYDARDQVQSIYEATVEGKQSISKELFSWFKTQARMPISMAISACMNLMPAILLSVLMGAMLPDGGETGSSLQFMLRLSMMLGFAQMGIDALSSIEICVGAAKTIIDRIAPILISLLTALGSERNLALISPTSTLVGNIAESIFMKYGIALCKCALCIAIAGNLSNQIRLKRVQRMIGQIVSWTTGAIVTVFTALLALQTNINESLDGIAVRTAKYAVDSASPVIGSGISDAWDSYLYGVMATKNAVGVSGIAALFFAAVKPILICLCMMLALNLVAAMLDAFGERCSAEAAEQIAGVCQMALAICTASLMITMILLGAMMKVGQGIIS